MATEETNGNHDLLIAWLNDAYAFEQSLIPVLKAHARDANGHKEVSARLERHAEQTQRHAELVKQCVEQLGASTSTLKSSIGVISGIFQAASNGTSSDDLVKNNIADYAAEHFEIACYRSLVTAANNLGERRIAQICEEILHDEEDMAHFLEQQLPITASGVLHEHAASRSPDE